MRTPACSTALAANASLSFSLVTVSNVMKPSVSWAGWRLAMPCVRYSTRPLEGAEPPYHLEYHVSTAPPLVLMLVSAAKYR